MRREVNVLTKIERRKKRQKLRGMGGYGDAVGSLQLGPNLIYEA